MTNGSRISDVRRESDRQKIKFSLQCDAFPPKADKRNSYYSQIPSEDYRSWRSSERKRRKQRLLLLLRFRSLALNVLRTGTWNCPVFLTLFFIHSFL